MKIMIGKLFYFIFNFKVEFVVGKETKLKVRIVEQI